MKKFKAESQRLLDMMIHSIYTNQDIFLRELISNASDANDKLYYQSLQDTSIDIDRNDLKISIAIDADGRRLLIRDNGIGMNKEDLETYLGTIAKSDSHDFKTTDKDDAEAIIGQFGVGFYAAFMVSERIKVTSKAYGTDNAYVFESNGLDGYTISEGTLDTHGTLVELSLKPNHAQANFDQYLQPLTIQTLVKQYSDYIRYPIVMDIDGEPTTLNSMIPLWKRTKADVTDEDLQQFYKDTFHDYDKPMRTMQMKVEGSPSFDALLFIPNHAPLNFYSPEFEPGLQLYSRGVFIMNRHKKLIPEHFRFVQGLVDSPDLSLNISREILQNDHQLQLIANRIERRIQSELEKMLANSREDYEHFWKAFGMPIKYGLYASFGQKRDSLEKLLMFETSADAGFKTLAEYMQGMSESQKEIYYVSGSSRAMVAQLPQTQFVTSKGFEVIYLTQDIDEFVIQVLQKYEDVPFKSITDVDLDIEEGEAKTALDEKRQKAEPLVESIKKSLGSRVDDVVLSSRLMDHPVALVSTAGMSFEMEKVLNQMPDRTQDFKAKRILELNADHQLVAALEKLEAEKPELIDDISSVLLDQACLLGGVPVEDVIGFSQKIANLVIEAAKFSV